MPHPIISDHFCRCVRNWDVLRQKFSQPPSVYLYREPVPVPPHLPSAWSSFSVEPCDSYTPVASPYAPA